VWSALRRVVAAVRNGPGRRRWPAADLGHHPQRAQQGPAAAHWSRTL